MTQLRCTLFALLGLSLAACSEDATIVSVNYSYGEGVAIKDNSDTQVHVLITQGGQKVEETFATPLVSGTELETLADGGVGTGMVAIMIPDNAFFKRYELGGFAGGEAKLTAELLDGTTVLYKSESVFDVRENGAVVAYVDFVVEPPAPETGSSAETASSSSAPTDAGSDSGATPTSAPDAASSSASPSSSDAAATASDSGTVVEAGTASDSAATGASDAATSGGSDASTGG